MTLLVSWADVERFFRQIGAFVEAEPLGVAMGVGGAMGATIGALVMHGTQKEEERIFPCIYSGVQRFSETNVAVDYYGAVNDMVMSVTGAWNARGPKERTGAFLERLKASELGPCARRVRLVGKDLHERLETHAQLLKRARRAEKVSQSSWKYSKRDNYRTETYTVTTTDSQGRTRTQTRTRQVYKNTDHWFSFFPESATHLQNATGELCDTFKLEDLYSPGLEQYVVEPAEALPSGGGPYRAAQGPTSTLGALTEEDSVQQTILEDDDAEVSADDVREWVNVWLRSALGQAAIARAHFSLDALSREKDGLFRRVYASDQHYHFRTTSRSHSGPDGYQASKEIEAHIAGMTKNLGALFASLEDVRERAALLEKLGEGEVPSGWGRRRKDMPKRALDHAIEVYLAAFPDSSIDMDQRSSGVKTAVGLGVGALIGVIIAYIVIVSFD